MILRQKCFLTLKDFENNPKFRKGNGPGGVYLWGFSMEDNDFSVPTSPNKFFPFYVGKIYDDLYGRTAEHLAYLCGGNYPIFKIRECYNNKTLIGDVLKAYKSSVKASPNSLGTCLPDSLYPNLLHFPQGIHLSKRYFTDADINSELDWMIKHFCITYFIPEKPNKSDIDQLEKKIGNTIGYNKLITKPYKNPKDFKVEIANEPENVVIDEYNDLFKSCRGTGLGSQIGII